MPAHGTSVLTSVLACLFLLTARAPAPLHALPAAAGGGKGKLEWRTLEAGLEAARANRSPAILWYPGEESAPAAKSPFDAYLEDTDFRRVASRFVLVRLAAADLGALYPVPPVAPAAAGGAAPPPPAPVAEERTGERLRILPQSAALIVLDFRERVVRRRDGGDALPERAHLLRDLARLSARNRRFVEQDKELRRVFDTSLAAFRQGKVREAVLKVLPYDPPAGRDALDPVLRREVEAIIKDYRDRAEKLIDQAEELVDDARRRPQNSAKKFAAAIKVYDELARDYPFPDFIAIAAREKNEILTHIPGPLPGALPGPR